jgi:hypothetical protein
MRKKTLTPHLGSYYILTQWMRFIRAFSLWLAFGSKARLGSGKQISH